MIRRALVLLLLVAVCVASPLLAQPPSEEPSAPAVTAPADEPPAADDGWGFEEDEEIVDPGWLESARAQWADLTLFAAFATLAMVSFFRKSVPLKYVTFGAAILYMGFYKSQLISVVNIYSLLTWNLPGVKHNLTFYFFAIFTVASTILWGRLYCGRICAYGALTQALDRIVPAKLRVEVPAKIEQRANYIKYGLLVGTLAYFFATTDIPGFRYVEPFWMFTLHSTPLLWTMLAVLLIATIFVRNLYCRFLCPVGAFLGILSNLTVFRIKRWSECKTCKICEKTCEWGAIRGPQIIASECVRCDDCERLYMDQKKCPHWIIIQRKSDVLAKQAAAAAAAGKVAVPGRA